MKQLLTVSSNYFAVRAENGLLLPEVEVILVLSEPTYAVDAVGELVKHRETSQSRFVASPKVLRKLAEALLQFAAEADLPAPAPTKEENR